MNALHFSGPKFLTAQYGLMKFQLLGYWTDEALVFQFWTDEISVAQFMH